MRARESSKNIPAAAYDMTAWLREEEGLLSDFSNLLDSLLFLRTH